MGEVGSTDLLREHISHHHGASDRTMVLDQTNLSVIRTWLAISCTLGRHGRHTQPFKTGFVHQNIRSQAERRFNWLEYSAWFPEGLHRMLSTTSQTVTALEWMDGCRNHRRKDLFMMYNDTFLLNPENSLFYHLIIMPWRHITCGNHCTSFMFRMFCGGARKVAVRNLIGRLHSMEIYPSSGSLSPRNIWIELDTHLTGWDHKGTNVAG